jgi:outer membrane cobalamin receptor
LLSNTTYFVLTGYYKNKDVSISLGEVRNDPVNGVIPKKENATIRSDMYGNFGFEEEFGTKFELNHQFAKDYSLSSGFEINSISAKYDFVLNTVDTIFTFDRNDYRPDPTKQYLVLYPAMLNNIYDDKSINGSAFTEFTGTLFDGLTFNLGGRYEYAGLSKTNYFSPRFSFAYYFTPNLRFNFATGVYYQAPDFLIITELNANKSLKNEKSTHIIGGLTSYLSDEYKLTVEGYYKDFTDLIVRADRTSPLRVNGGKGWSAGIDISVVKRLTENWYGQVNYSYSQSQRDDNLGEGWYNSDFNQPNIFNILVGYEFNKEWAISLKWKYATGRPLDSYIVHGDVFNDPNFLRYSKEVTSNNTRRFDDFHTLNVRVDYRLQIGKFAMVMFLDIGNIYSRLNVNEERFIYRDGSIVKRGYEISPTFGMKVEF